MCLSRLGLVLSVLLGLFSLSVSVPSTSSSSSSSSSISSSLLSMIHNHTLPAMTVSIAHDPLYPRMYFIEYANFSANPRRDPTGLIGIINTRTGQLYPSINIINGSHSYYQSHSHSQSESPPWPNMYVTVVRMDQHRRLHVLDEHNGAIICVSLSGVWLSVAFSPSGQIAWNQGIGAFTVSPDGDTYYVNPYGQGSSPVYQVVDRVSGSLLFTLPSSTTRCGSIAFYGKQPDKLYTVDDSQSTLLVYTDSGTLLHNYSITGIRHAYTDLVVVDSGPAIALITTNNQLCLVSVQPDDYSTVECIQGDDNYWSHIEGHYGAITIDKNKQISYLVTPNSLSTSNLLTVATSISSITATD